MGEAVLSSTTFKSEAIRTIAQEVEQALNADYLGAAFEGGRGEIEVFYAGGGYYMGQSQYYPARLWPDIEQVMQLLNASANVQGWPEPAMSTEGAAFETTRWTVLPYSMGQGLPVFQRLLQRADEILIVIAAPLE